MKNQSLDLDISFIKHVIICYFCIKRDFLSYIFLFFMYYRTKNFKENLYYVLFSMYYF